jgi:5'-methylthioadenosine phosphorylase
MGWQVINMAGYPEVVLAREKEICYAAVGVVTDYDSGLVVEGKVKPVSAEEVVKIFKENIDKIKDLILTMIKEWPKQTTCECQTALVHARFS